MINSSTPFRLRLHRNNFPRALCARPLWPKCVCQIKSELLQIRCFISDLTNQPIHPNLLLTAPVNSPIQSSILARLRLKQTFSLKPIAPLHHESTGDPAELGDHGLSYFILTLAFPDQFSSPGALFIDVVAISE